LRPVAYLTYISARLAYT